jgi:hypothetical protein
MDKLGGAVFVFGVCSFLIMTIILNVSLKMVENISENTPKRSDREKWQLQIIDSKTISKNAETIKSLDVLEEKIRYSADDINNGCPQNKEIVDILDAIKLQIEFNPDAMVDELIKKIDSLLVNRDTYLKISR